MVLNTLKTSHLSLAFAATLALSSTAAFSNEANRIAFQEKVTVKVGEQVVIHGMRGDCGKLPSKRDRKAFFDANADIGIGQLIEGERGVRGSRSCGGTTPAIEVVFVATQKGRTRIEIFGDDIRLRVK